MKILIAGAGKIGYALCESLAAEAHDLVIIDKNPEALKDPGDLLDVITVCGNAASAVYLVRMPPNVSSAVFSPIFFMVASRKFIVGLPMKSATKILFGRL